MSLDTTTSYKELVPADPGKEVTVQADPANTSGNYVYVRPQSNRTSDDALKLDAGEKHTFSFYQARGGLEAKGETGGETALAIY